MPSASTAMGVSRNDAEARHRRCAPGQHVAGQGVGQKIAVGQHQHPVTERGQQVAGQGLLADGVGADRGPDQRPGARLRGNQPADLRERPGCG